MIGGALKVKKMIKNENTSALFAVFFMIVLVLFIKAYLFRLPII